MFPNLDPETLALFKKIQSLAGEQPVYLVGGAVRDLLLGQNPKDLDFALASGSIALAKAVKNALHGVWFALDDARQTARVIVGPGKPEERVLDFVSFAGTNLDEDLRNRDFAVNAMALSLSDPGTLIDPLQGQEFLNSGILRVASEESIHLDPLRALRSIRMMRKFSLKPDPLTAQLISEGASGIKAVSGERMRDELFKLLDCPDFAESLCLMHELNLLEPVFPDIGEVLKLERIQPHVYDLWGHTLQVILYTESLVMGQIIATDRDGSGQNLQLAIDKLKPYKERILADLRQPLQGGRQRSSLLLLAALYHDVGKAGSRTAMPDGRLHFRDHPTLGSTLVADLNSRLLLGTEEASYLQLMVAQHMRIHFLAKPQDPLSRRAIYHYFQDLGQFGVDLTLLSLADMLAAYEQTINPVRWLRELELTVQLIDSWYSRQSEVINPLKLLDGNDLMRIFSLQPSPLLGQILSNLREAQAEGLVSTEHEAVAYCTALVEKSRMEVDDALE
jgi:tRNA nucleotidyltransferase/poly(A) polymerase